MRPLNRSGGLRISTVRSLAEPLNSPLGKETVLDRSLGRSYLQPVSVEQIFIQKMVESEKFLLANVLHLNLQTTVVKTIL
jgi:hypothetical protein